MIKLCELFEIFTGKRKQFLEPTPAMPKGSQTKEQNISRTSSHTTLSQVCLVESIHYRSLRASSLLRGICYSLA